MITYLNIHAINTTNIEITNTNNNINNTITINTQIKNIQNSVNILLLLPTATYTHNFAIGNYKTENRNNHANY